jgi:hypothetical protein
MHHGLVPGKTYGFGERYIEMHDEDPLILHRVVRALPRFADAEMPHEFDHMMRFADAELLWRWADWFLRAGIDAARTTIETNDEHRVEMTWEPKPARFMKSNLSLKLVDTLNWSEDLEIWLRIDDLVGYRDWDRIDLLSTMRIADMLSHEGNSEWTLLYRRKPDEIIRPKIFEVMP